MPGVLDVGTRVTSSDGRHVGNLRHVVLDRQSLRATHVVVDIGPLRAGAAVLERGLAGDYDRTVELRHVTGASERGIALDLSEAEFMREPEYTTEHFERPHDMTPEDVDLSDLVRVAQTSLSWLPTVDPAIWIVPAFRRGEDERHVREGTPVWRQQPHEKIGEVDKLLLDEQTGRVSAFVIRRGFLARHAVVLPVRFVTELLEDIVRVNITDDEIRGLGPYEEAPQG